MNKEIKVYRDSLSASDKKICDLLAYEIDALLTEAESKIWHKHPFGS